MATYRDAIGLQMKLTEVYIIVVTKEESLSSVLTTSDGIAMARMPIRNTSTARGKLM